jgi:hypothetical protein
MMQTNNSDGASQNVLLLRSDKTNYKVQYLKYFLSCNFFSLIFFLPFIDVNGNQ